MRQINMLVERNGVVATPVATIPRLPDNWVAKSVAKHEGAGGAAFDGSPEHVLAWRCVDFPSFTASVPSEADFFCAGAGQSR